MRGLWAGCLSATLGLAAALSADEIRWRPAPSAPATPPAAAAAPGAALGRPMPMGVLGRPTPLARPPPMPAAPAEAVPASAVHDPGFVPASFRPVVASSPVFRAQGTDAKPMPPGTTADKKPAAAPEAQTETITVRPREVPKEERLVPVPSAGVCSSGCCPGPDSCCVCPGDCCPCPTSCCPCPTVCGRVCQAPCCDECQECCDPYGCCPGSRFWVRAEYLLWQIKDPSVPPLVTTSPQASNGVLGLPGTAVVFGPNARIDEQSGGRFTAGYWFDDCQTWGLEGGFFFLSPRSVNANFASTGDPLLARPFFNVLTGTEDSELVARTPSPGVLPVVGAVGVSMTSRLWGFDINGVRRIARWDWGRWDFLFGYRFLNLDEGLGVTENLIVPANSPALAGTTFILTDRFGTNNFFSGGQIGTRFLFTRGKWDLELIGKLALGVTRQEADVSGGSTTTTPGGGVTSAPGGLYTQPTNIGSYSQHRFGVVPELGANIGYNINEHWRILAGFTFLYWSSVARPGDQVDRFVNPTQLTGGTLQGTPAPNFRFNTTDFWVQGVNFGLQFTY